MHAYVLSMSVCTCAVLTLYAYAWLCGAGNALDIEWMKSLSTRVNEVNHHTQSLLAVNHKLIVATVKDIDSTLVMRP